MNRKFIVLPKWKRRTLKDQDVWLWTQEESKMSGKVTVPCSMDKIIKKLISDRFEITWRLAFGHKEDSI